MEYVFGDYVDLDILWLLFKPSRLLVPMSRDSEGKESQMSGASLVEKFTFSLTSSAVGILDVIMVRHFVPA